MFTSFNPPRERLQSVIIEDIETINPFRNISPHVNESGKFLPVESGILDFRIWNTARGIQNRIIDCNPDSKLH